ncbi:MAG: TetR/AcrR family transcriptional regulator [Caldilineaceae bacterium]
MSSINKVEQKKARIIQHVTQHLIEQGLADVGLRTLAKVAGTSDRMLIYYFETKDALLGEVLQTIASNFALQLDGLLGQHPRTAETLRAELWTLSSSPQFGQIIQLWFELVGLAARGQEPYAVNATAIADNWLQWIERRLEDPQAGEAIALFAELEGRLMMKLIGVDAFEATDSES